MNNPCNKYLVAKIEDNELGDSIVISEKKDWDEQHCLTEDYNQEDILDIINELGLYNLCESTYDMYGIIKNADDMIKELINRGFIYDKEFQSWVNSTPTII